MKLLTVTWVRVKEMVRTPHYWETYAILVEILYQPAVLLAEEGSPLGVCLNQVG